jgi:hypothetical protein
MPKAQPANASRTEAGSISSGQFWNVTGRSQRLTESAPIDENPAEVVAG